MTEHDEQRPRANGGGRWWIALIAVGAALVPSALTLAIWLGTGDRNDPEQELLRERIERALEVHESRQELIDAQATDRIMQIYVQSQLDPDECMADFAETADEPSSARLPFYFC